MAEALSLDEALDAVSVHPAQEILEANGGNVDLKNWYAVSTDASGGVIAYFASEEAAFAYRLTLVNALCNPLGFKGV